MGFKLCFNQLALNCNPWRSLRDGNGARVTAGKLYLMLTTLARHVPRREPLWSDPETTLKCTLQKLSLAIRPFAFAGNLQDTLLFEKKKKSFTSPDQKYATAVYVNPNPCVLHVCNLYASWVVFKKFSLQGLCLKKDARVRVLCPIVPPTHSLGRAPATTLPTDAASKLLSFP